MHKYEDIRFYISRFYKKLLKIIALFASNHKNEIPLNIMAICMFKNPLLCFIIIPWSPIKFVEGDICDEFLLPKTK